MEKLTIGIITNIVFETYTYKVKKYFRESGYDIDILSIPFETLFLDDVRNKLYKPDILVLLLNFEFLFSDFSIDIYRNEEIETDYIRNTIHLYKKVITYLKACSNKRILVVGLEDYYMHTHYVRGAVGTFNLFVDKINQQLLSILDDGMVYIDLKQLIALVGIECAYDIKNKYRWCAPYSNQLVFRLINEIYKQYLVYKGVTPKCLVLDCDNVLWGGILSEDGMEQIQLGNYGRGKAFQDFQRFLVMLYLHGVILAVSSKNDMEDIQEVFRTHSGMVLKEEHIAYFQVNWNSKAESLKKISTFLNIGLEDMVFVDDSRFEIESINILLPQVKTIQYKPDSIYKDLACFNLSNVDNINEIEKRNATYRTNSSREELKKQYEKYQEYLNALNMKVLIKEALPTDLYRIAELTQRTNKCTNGKRFTFDKLKKQIEEVTLYSVFVSDKFSDMGLVGAIAVKGEALLLFSLSCRVLGRNIENKMMEFIKGRHSIKKIYFTSTKKNIALQEMFIDNFKESELIED